MNPNPGDQGIDFKVEPRTAPSRSRGLASVLVPLLGASILILAVIAVLQQGHISTLDQEKAGLTGANKELNEKNLELVRETERMQKALDACLAQRKTRGR